MAGKKEMNDESSQGALNISRGDKTGGCTINNCNEKNKEINGPGMVQQAVRVQRKASYLGIMNQKVFVG